MLGVAVFVLVAPGAAAAQTLIDFLWKQGFPVAELQKLEQGEPVARTLRNEVIGPNGTAEVVAMGAIRVEFPREALVKGLHDVAAWRKDGVVSFGRIGLAPQAADFAGLSLPASDLDGLRTCEPGECLLKLPGPVIAGARQRIDWRAADGAEQASRFLRESLLNFMCAYAGEGGPALPGLEDKPVKVDVGRSLAELFEGSAELRADSPELFAAVREYPKHPLPDATHVFYWSVNDFGLKPTITLVHAAAYAPPGGSGAVVVWKQLWASHYFNGGVSATFYRAEPGGCYLLHVARLRVDGLGGLLGAFKRGKMSGAMVRWTERFLTTTRGALSAKP
jgi:hypothetical protein